MARPWTPTDINRLIAVSTGCLCLPIIVLGVLMLISEGALSADQLGTVKGVGVGGGLLGLASIVALVIKMGVSGGTAK